MTDPFPSVQPGVVAPPMDSTEKRTKKLERQQDSLANRDLTNAIVGQGGSFRATLVDGGSNVLAIKKGNPLYGAKQLLQLKDINDHNMYQLDEFAGYGLAAPIYSYFMAPLIGTTGTAGVPAKYAISESFVYNPTWFVKALIRNMTGAATSWSVVLQVTAPGLPTITSSPVVFTGGAIFFSRAVLLPAAYMNAQNVEGCVVATPNNTGAIDVWPITSRGATKSFYDFNPPLQ